MSKYYPVEQRERAVKLVLDHLDEYSESDPSSWPSTEPTASAPWWTSSKNSAANPTSTPTAAPAIRTLNLVARAAGRAPARLADTVALHLAEGSVHLFHPATGQRLT